MEYFLSHIVYILIAGVILALLAAIWAFVGIRNDQERDINDERCDFTCGSCPNTAICHKEEKRNDL
jgi:hypothetical protein